MKTFTCEVEIDSTRTEYVRRWVRAASLEEAETALLHGNYEEEVSHEETTDTSERLVGIITETEER